ncbi:MAG: hypothetical protein OEV27_06775 [Nitrospira sp.]|nr:hypothetical protein [Nitrospira sp.]MDH4250879.1 hypothetical protein [Nitrospira sp.]MDH4343153.1 hypothetical protein [Nitrospira sp.]
MPIRMVATPLLGVGLLALMLIVHVGIADAQVKCWVPRQNEGPVTDKRWARHLKAMSAAETILKQSQEFLNSPVPVRLRTTMATNRYKPNDSRLIVQAYPEQTSLGIEIWQGACGISPDADRVAGSIGKISIFFNHLSKDMFMGQDEIPELTGMIGGYPEYNGWVVISKNGRLPWIPQTLGDRLDRVGAVRERALADWRNARALRKAPDQTLIDRTAALRRKTDPAGADQYVENMRRLTADIQAGQAKDAARGAQLTKLLNDYHAYRASFTAQQLAMPAVWADTDGSVRKSMETQIDELQTLSLDEQERVGEIREHSRSLEREAMASDNEAVALRLRTQAMDLLQDADQVSKDHGERAALEEEALRGAYELTNLKPGLVEHALTYKMDPTFPSLSQPGKIQVIVVSILTLAEEDILQRPEQAARKAWLDRVKESIDYAALAALLD